MIEGEESFQRHVKKSLILIQVGLNRLTVNCNIEPLDSGGFAGAIETGLNDDNRYV